MQLAQVTIHHVRLPLRDAWHTAAGRATCTDTVVLRGVDHDGTVVWTETCPLGEPTYLPETAATTFVVLRDHFVPAVLGHPLPELADLEHRLAPFRGNSFARAGVDQLWWTLRAERLGVPLHRLLGGELRPIATGVAVSRQPDLQTLLARVADAFAQGAPRVKLKIVPGYDLEPLLALRVAFPDGAFMVDANAAYTLADLPLFRALDELGLMMIEQPLHYRDLAEHAALQRQLRTPICLDESITCEADAEHAIHLGAASAINLKPGRVGGLGPALAIYRRCLAADVECWIGGMLESGLGTAVSLALATLPGCRRPADLHPGGHFHDVDLIHDPFVAPTPCHLQPRDQPGIGVQIDEAALARHTVASITLG